MAGWNHTQDVITFFKGNNIPTSWKENGSILLVSREKFSWQMKGLSKCIHRQINNIADNLINQAGKQNSYTQMRFNSR